MKKIIDYMIVQGEEAHELVDRVNSYIQQGWQPIGGVSYATYEQGRGGYTTRAQAMVKYED